MASLTDDYADDARKRMVDSQLRPNKVTDPRILTAMRTLPRERFLPPALSALAYSDQNVSLGGGRVLLQPMTLARLIQAMEPLAGDKTLIVGAGTGYAAAVLAACGCTVTALEESGPLLDLAKAAPTGATIVSGPLAAGWPAGAPYDLILIDGAVTEVPAAIAAQLKPETGRLVTILSQGRTSHAIKAEATAAGISVRPLFDCLCPELPAFARAPAFEF